MKAAVVAVGTELLGVDRLDTNSLYLARVLEGYGVELRRKAVLGDAVDDIAARAARGSRARSTWSSSAAASGPTADDVTREATAQAFGRGLVLDPGALDALEARFRSYRHPDAAAQPQAGGPASKARRCSPIRSAPRRGSGSRPGAARSSSSPACRASSRG